MTKFAILFLLILGGELARADLVMVQRVEGAGQSGEQTVRVKDGKARSDIAGAVSVIVDRATGEATTLAHAQRGFLTLTPERSKAMADKMAAARGSQTPPALVATGRTEKIGEYGCAIFTTDLGKMKITYWLAKDYPNFAAILAQLDVLDSAPLASASAGVAPRTKDLPGMPMKMQMEMGGQKVTVTLVSAKEEKVDPAIFAIPSGYKEMPGPAAEPAAPAKP